MTKLFCRPLSVREPAPPAPPQADLPTTPLRERIDAGWSPRIIDDEFCSELPADCVIALPKRGLSFICNHYGENPRVACYEGRWVCDDIDEALRLRWL